MLKLHVLTLLVCSLSQVFASPVNSVDDRDISSQEMLINDIPVVNLHVVNKKLAPDGYEREYVSFQTLNVGATLSVLL